MNTSRGKKGYKGQLAQKYIFCDIQNPINMIGVNTYTYPGPVMVYLCNTDDFLYTSIIQ